jgi:hypothetical protein
MEAIERLNRDLFRELGPSGGEVRTLIGAPAGRASPCSRSSVLYLDRSF